MDSLFSMQDLTSNKWKGMSLGISPALWLDSELVAAKICYPSSRLNSPDYCQDWLPDWMLFQQMEKPLLFLMPGSYWSLLHSSSFFFHFYPYKHYLKSQCRWLVVNIAYFGEHSLSSQFQNNNLLSCIHPLSPLHPPSFSLSFHLRMEG